MALQRIARLQVTQHAGDQHRDCAEQGEDGEHLAASPQRTGGKGWLDRAGTWGILAV